jgi:hypothetical protein
MQTTDPNALGAPTEGLGQNITFKFQPPSTPPQVQALRDSAIQANVYGGGTGGGRTTAPGVQQGPTDPTLGVLLKVGESIAKPIVERRRQEAFFDGMQRAMQGEAIQDIAASTPWWANIFGDADTTEGARAYLGQSRAHEVVGKLDSDMERMRKLPPAEARTAYNQVVNENLTGDRATDAAVLRGLTSALPNLMRRQAKEHYAWNQERASAAESMSFNAGAKNLQATLSSDKETPEQKSMAALTWVVSQVPAEGRDLENWKRRTTADLVGQAKLGNLHVLNAAMAKLPGTGSSLVDDLTPEQRNQVLAAQDAAESQQRLQYSFEYATELAQIKAQAAAPLPADPESGRPAQTAADVEKLVDGLNRKYQEKTGSSRGLITPMERAGLAKQSAIAIAHTHELAAKDALKREQAVLQTRGAAAAQEDRSGFIRQAIATGQSFSLQYEKGFTEDELNREAFTLYNTGPEGTPPTADSRAVTMLPAYRFNHKFTKVRDSIKGFVNAAVASASPDAFKSQYANWQAMHKRDPQMAAYYYGDNAEAMVRYDEGIKAGGGHAHGMFLFNQKPLPKTFSAKEIAVVDSTVRSVKDDMTPGWAGGLKMRPETLRLIRDTYGQDIERSTAGLSGDIGTATRTVLRNGDKLEIVGGFAWQRTPESTDLYSFLTKSENAPRDSNGAVAVPSDKVGDIVSAAFQHRIDEASAGQPAAWVTIIPRGDVNRVPQYTIFVAREDGRQDRLDMSGSEIFSRYTRSKERATTIQPVLTPDENNVPAR